jgi:hypothetical protein
VEDTVFEANTNPNRNEPPTIVTATLPRLVAVNEDVNTTTGSIGVKINPGGSLLITLNGLFSISDDGLQTDFAPLVAIDYSF